MASDTALPIDPTDYEFAALEAERQAIEDEAHAARAEAEVAQLREKTSWAPIDLGTIATGDLRPPVPRFLTRTDGAGLLYAGRTHSFIGPTESGKTLLAYVACAQVLMTAGGGTVYVDFEGEAVDYFRWLVQLGVPVDSIVGRSQYIRPDEPLNDVAKVAIRNACVAVDPLLIVLDGVTEAMMLHDLDDFRGTEVSRFMQMFPRQFERAGGSVILIDHVPHGGNRATGSQHKGSAVTGASYLFTKTAPLAPGRHGKIEIEVRKDRPGEVRRVSSGGKKVGTFHVMPAPERGPDAVDAYVEAPPEYSDTYRNAAAMERMFRFIEDNPGASRTAAVESGGDVGDNRDALDALVQDGFLNDDSRRHGEREYHKYTALKPFRTPSDLPSDSDGSDGSDATSDG